MAALQVSKASSLPPAPRASYPRGPLGEGLRQIAQLVKADLGVEVAFVETGGWDHHAAQGAVSGQLALRLRDLGASLAAFQHDLGVRGDDVVLVTLTEFGRTVRENGNRGTDHGHGTAMMVMGGTTKGGKILGNWPTLDPAKRFEGRDLAVTTDFRDLFGEILVRHLGAADLGAVFPGYQGDVKRWVGVLG